MNKLLNKMDGSHFDPVLSLKQDCPSKLLIIAESYIVDRLGESNINRLYSICRSDSNIDAREMTVNRVA
jgi:hypothetical protein